MSLKSVSKLPPKSCGRKSVSKLPAQMIARSCCWNFRPKSRLHFRLKWQPEVGVETSGSNERCRNFRPKSSLHFRIKWQPEVGVETSGSNQPEVGVETSGSNQPEVGVEISGSNDSKLVSPEATLPAARTVSTSNAIQARNLDFWINARSSVSTLPVERDYRKLPHFG